MVSLDIGLLGGIIALAGGLVALLRIVVINPLDSKFERLRTEILTHVDRTYVVGQDQQIYSIEVIADARARQSALWAASVYVALKKQGIDIPDPSLFNWQSLSPPRVDRPIVKDGER